MWNGKKDFIITENKLRTIIRTLKYIKSKTIKE